jgi:hypothetical protein
MLWELEFAVQLGKGRRVVAREKVFRGRFISVIGVLAAAGTAAAFFIPVSSDPSSGYAFAVAPFPEFIYFFWLLGWHSAVRIRASGVMVDNLLFRHVIPWGDLADITVGYGLVFRLKDGRKVGSLMFGGSLGGQLLGYPWTRRVAVRMRKAAEELSLQGDEREQQGTYRCRFYVSPWPPLAILVTLEVIAALGNFLH